MLKTENEGWIIVTECMKAHTESKSVRMCLCDVFGSGSLWAAGPAACQGEWPYLPQTFT